MSDAIRVGLVGFGYASKTFHAPLIGGTPGMALTRVSSSEAGKVHADWPGVRVVKSVAQTAPCSQSNRGRNKNSPAQSPRRRSRGRSRKNSPSLF